MCMFGGCLDVVKMLWDSHSTTKDHHFQASSLSLVHCLLCPKHVLDADYKLQNELLLQFLLLTKQKRQIKAYMERPGITQYLQLDNI